MDLAKFIYLAEQTPEDDALRLAAADWLEEHEQVDSAEFIRIQMQLSQLGADAPERTALEAREKELLPGSRILLPEWQRNYAERRQYATRTERGLTQVRAATCGNIEAEFPRLAAMPALRELHVDFAMGEEVGTALAQAPWFPHIQHLQFNYFDDGLRYPLRALFTRNAASNLRELEFIATQGSEIQHPGGQLIILPRHMFFSSASAQIERIRYGQEQWREDGTVCLRQMSAEENASIANSFFNEYRNELEYYIQRFPQQMQIAPIEEINHVRLLSLREVNGITVPQEIRQLQEQVIALQQANAVPAPNMFPASVSGPASGTVQL